LIEKKINLIFGKRGSGKSYLAQSLVEKYDRLFIFDTLGEYTGGVVFEDPEKLKEFWGHIYKKKFRIIYRPLIPQQEFDWIAELIYELGDVTLLVEEIDAFASPYQVSREFAQLLQRGRHKNIELIGVTQRPFGIPRLLTSQAKQIYVFNTNEPRDLEYLRSLLGTAAEEKIKTLEQYQYALWEDGSTELSVGKA